MSQKVYYLYFSLLILILIIAIVPSTYAQSGGSYDLSWSTLDGGGGQSSGGSFSVSGTAGQGDASNAKTGGTFEHISGFWSFLETTLETMEIFCYKDGNDIRIEWTTPGTFDIYYGTVADDPGSYSILGTGQTSPYYHINALVDTDPQYFYDVRQ